MLARYRNPKRAFGEAVGGIAAAIAVWAAAAWAVDDGVLGARQWQRLDRTGAATHGVWAVLLVLSVVALLAVCLAVIVRAARHGAVVSEDRLLVRRVFSTSCVLISDIARVPYEMAPERTLVVVLADGRGVHLSWLARARPPDGGPPLRVLLHGLVAAAPPSAASHAVVRHPAARARERTLLACTMTALLLAAAGAVFTACDWHDEHVAEQRRTAVADASVTGVHFVDGDAPDEPRSDVEITFTAGEMTVTGEVSKPGRSALQVEDVVSVAYDPHDVSNVELAARPPIEPAGYRAVLAVGTAAALSAAGVLTWLLIAGVRRRAAGCA